MSGNKLFNQYKAVMRCTVAGFLLLFSLPSAAQQKTGSQKHKVIHLRLYASTKAFEDSIVIRWSPANATAWQLCNDSGYHLLRVDYSNPSHPVITNLTPAPLMPMTLQQMKAHLARDNKYAAIASEAMYGKDFRMTQEPPGSFAGKIIQAHEAAGFRFAFAIEAADFSAPVASALALRWVDKQVKKGGRYLYILSSTATNGTYVIDSVGVFVFNIKEKEIPVPQGLRAFGYDHRVELHWNRRQLGGFDAYNIERSDDGGKTWHLLNKLPFYSSYSSPKTSGNKKTDTIIFHVANILHDHQVYLDSIPKDYKTYYYRISGFNAFAEQSPYSKPVQIHGRDLTPPAPPAISSITSIAGNTLLLKWRQPEKSPDLKGYYIDRSNDIHGPFKPITKTLLKKTDTSFSDTHAIPFAPNYYSVIAVDTAFNVAASSPVVGYVKDRKPPDAPTGVTGTIDTNGVVHLHWDLNTNPGIQGYKVYYSYNPNAQFSQLTHTIIRGNEFTDSIPMNTLNREIYYEVAAVDIYNYHSAYSVPAELKKPVVVPPSAPAAGDVYTDDEGVHIQWFPSESEGAMSYQIFRKEENEPWKVLDTLPQPFHSDSFYYTDSTIRANTDYYYAAETIDSTGVHSPRSFKVHVRYNKSNTLPHINNLQAVLDNKQHAVKLSWHYRESGTYYFIVYRKYGDSPFIPWHSFDKSIQSCEDNEIRHGVYEYAIKAVESNRNSASGLSDPVVVTVQE